MSKADKSVSYPKYDIGISSLTILGKELFSFKVIGIYQDKDDLVLKLLCTKCGNTKEVRLRSSKVYTLYCLECGSRDYIDVVMGEEGLLEYSLISRADYVRAQRNSYKRGIEI